MDVDIEKSLICEENLNDQTKANGPRDESVEALKTYKNYILGNDDTFNIPSNLTSDEYKKLIEKIEEIDHTIASRSFKAKRQIRSLEKQSAKN